MTARRTGRTNDPEGLRRRLLDTAFTAFTTRGFGVTSVHDLQRAAQTTGGAFAHHFPSKKQLALAVLRERVSAAVEATWLAPVRAAASANAGIQRVFASIVLELDQKGAVSGCPLNNLALELSDQDPDFRASIETIFEHWTDTLAAKLSVDLRAGKISGIEPRRYATFVIAAYSGAMALAKATQSTAPLRICAAELAKPLQRRSS